eukprot:TRINITY_DN758_c0_g4_i1.p1 TRINITY_DN758_c0_g4~~TRINITY_DN758_c0_g4_i1.p1  ORF type:complete len:375 (+),score=-0.55 TRINITY_DN758_c0_g4_i1:175-1299(+)
MHADPITHESAEGSTHSPRWVSRKTSPRRMRQRPQFRRASVVSKDSLVTRSDRMMQASSQASLSSWSALSDQQDVPAVGSTVEVHSLKSAVGYNGLWGTVVSSAHAEGPGLLFTVMFPPPRGRQTLAASNLKLIRHAEDSSLRRSTRSRGTAGGGSVSCFKGRQGLTKGRLGVKLARHLLVEGRRGTIIAVLRGPISGPSNSWGAERSQADSILRIFAFLFPRPVPRLSRPVLTFDRRHEVVERCETGDVVCEEVDADALHSKLHGSRLSDSTAPAEGPPPAAEHRRGEPLSSPPPQELAAGLSPESTSLLQPRAVVPHPAADSASRYTADADEARSVDSRTAAAAAAAADRKSRAQARVRKTKSDDCGCCSVQ